MIKILNAYEQNFIDFLNGKHFTDKEVKLTVLQGYDCVSTSESDFGFAVYSVDDKTIMLPTVPPEVAEGDKDFIISNLAHEYKHFLQDVNGEDFNEEEADKFADEMCKEFESIKPSTQIYIKTDMKELPKGCCILTEKAILKNGLAFKPAKYAICPCIEYCEATFDPYMTNYSNRPSWCPLIEGELKEEK